jgi:hypothetical protein
VIPDLLWRCPHCATNDALRHSQCWLHAEVVDCAACGAQWRVRRVVGDNYYLKITRCGKSTTALSLGTELSITAWYDLMKQTVRLEALPEPPNLLEAGEKLYLASGQAILLVDAQPAYSGAEPLRPAAAEILPVSSPNLPVIGLCVRQVGTGHLFLTDQRMIWKQSPGTAKHPTRPSAEPQPLIFPLHQVNGIYTIMNLGMSFVAGMRQYFLRFENESPLKWVTYSALLAPQVQAASGHRIRTSHY